MAFAGGGCSTVGGIDAAATAGVSNADAVATLSYIWSGARDAINGAKESPKASFNIPVSLSGECPGGGSRNYSGTISGTNVGGSGTATVHITAALNKCGYDQTTTITTIDAPAVTVTGTIAIVSDAYGASTLTLTVPALTVNSVSCTGGIAMSLVATSPSSQPTATGTICGRSGAIPVP